MPNDLMNNSIMVAYPADSVDQLKVLYSIEQVDDLRTISCNVEGTRFPLWLQLRKFSISCIEKQGNHTTLFSEINNSKNMDTVLFIDLVYSMIMGREHRAFS